MLTDQSDEAVPQIEIPFSQVCLDGQTKAVNTIVASEALDSCDLGS